MFAGRAIPASASVSLLLLFCAPCLALFMNRPLAAPAPAIVWGANNRGTRRARRPGRQFKFVPSTGASRRRFNAPATPNRFESICWPVARQRAGPPDQSSAGCMSTTRSIAAWRQVALRHQDDEFEMTQKRQIFTCCQTILVAQRKTCTRSRFRAAQIEREDASPAQLGRAAPFE